MEDRSPAPGVRVSQPGSLLGSGQRQSLVLAFFAPRPIHGMVVVRIYLHGAGFKVFSSFDFFESARSHPIPCRSMGNRTGDNVVMHDRTPVIRTYFCVRSTLQARSVLHRARLVDHILHNV